MYNFRGGRKKIPLSYIQVRISGQSPLLLFMFVSSFVLLLARSLKKQHKISISQYC
jgi:hypothetical protein